MEGLSSLKVGDLGPAEIAFGRVLAITPEDVKTLQNLARVLLGQGHPEDAFELLEVALDIDRTSNDTHRLTARALAALGRTEDAAEAYGEAILLDETDAFAMNNLALLRLEQGTPDAALPLLARAVALGDDVALFHNNLGVALERVGRPRSAVEAYRRALLLDPGSERVAVNLERVETLAEADTRPLMDIVALADRFAQAVRAGGGDVGVEP
jgi:tetratricopeptide (TPR) repeat protein